MYLAPSANKLTKTSTTRLSCYKSHPATWSPSSCHRHFIFLWIEHLLSLPSSLLWWPEFKSTVETILDWITSSPKP